MNLTGIKECLQSEGREIGASDGSGVRDTVLAQTKFINELLLLNAKLEISNKEARNEIALAEKNASSISEQKTETVIKNQEIISSLSKIKEVEKEIESKKSERLQNIEKLFEENLQEIKKQENDFDDDKLAELERVNKQLYGEIKGIIEDFKAKEEKYKSDISRIKDNYKNEEAKIEEEVLKLKDASIDLDRVKEKLESTSVQLSFLVKNLNKGVAILPQILTSFKSKNKSIDSFFTEIEKLIFKIYEDRKSLSNWKSITAQLNELFPCYYKNVRLLDL